MGVWEIITIGLATIAVPSVILCIRHILNRERDRIERFNNAADDFRKVFNQALVHIRNDNADSILNVFSVDKDRLRAHQVVYLNFRHHLRGEYRNQYDDAWNQYYDDSIYQWDFDDSLREKLAKDIEDLLQFSEYRLLRNMSFVWQKILWRIRFGLFGSNEQMKEFLKSHERKRPLIKVTRLSKKNKID